ncbi:MAG: gliding motility-associated C-terminal domain-containing protein, partial [Elusimicrobiota bacterium]|nr:gliding motility-associated C-terminal domain-containing protein [Elusimicrobiota bacterium]
DRIQNTIVEVNAYRLNGQRITGDFNKQIKLTLPYDDINNNGIIDDTNPPLAEGNLKICLLNESNSEWQELGSSIVDAEANHISADISHFSVYILMSSIGYSSSLSNAYVWPNPFYPSKKPYITFSNITNFARIRIYTITGELVKEAVENSGVGYFQWDGKNNANKKTASGVYFYIISNNTGENKKGKIAVIR